MYSPVSKFLFSKVLAAIIWAQKLLKYGLMPYGGAPSICLE